MSHSAATAVLLFKIRDPPRTRHPKHPPSRPHALSRLHWDLASLNILPSLHTSLYNHPMPRGLHSFAEPGTGEAIADEIIAMLESLKEHQYPCR